MDSDPSPAAQRNEHRWPVTLIEPDQGWPLVNWAELWRYRELLVILTQRDLKVKYRQAIVGVAWVVLQPLATMAVFTLLFGLLGRRPVGEEHPYAVSVFCGLLPWQLFATSLTMASGSLVNNRQVITKVYFPRLLLPLASVMGALVDFFVTLGVLVLLMIGYRILPSPGILLFPAWLLLVTITAFGAGLLLGGLNALYRDVGYIVPFLVQFGFFISPVIYETGALIPPRWQPIFALNPMVGVLESFRWMVLGQRPAQPVALLISIGMAIGLLFIALYVFRRVERKIADRI